MNNRKLILLISISFSLLVNIPRIVFLFGTDNGERNGFLDVSWADTAFRIVMLFVFCTVVLYYNVNGLFFLKLKNKFLNKVLITSIFFWMWLLFFELINQLVYDFNMFSLNSRLNRFIYLFSAVVLIVISSAIEWYNQSKKDALEKEQLKQQNLQNELNALKNQVNPHFLFNSLNSLSLLVREDQKAAGKFINKLSFLYRYILQSKDQDVVTLKEELKFLDSYTHLIQQRYRDNFEVKITIDEALLQQKIPTMALQLLMENAIKHNEISTKKPLQAVIFNLDNWLVVQNNLQPRTGSVESTNTGLKNLNSRCELLLNQSIKIEKTANHFIVKIPLA